MFADTATITIKAGNGGNGLVSFRREIYVPAGGPDGGDGGRGGDVVFYVDKELTTLIDFRNRTRFFAKNGEDGKAKKCKGADAEDLCIGVPEGTVVRDAKTGKIVADMTGEDTRVVIAKGGNGGWGNTHFATPVRQAPRFAKSGIKTEEKELILELKLIADVGLLGFPNVGKSTLLASVTAARPKIANYHFTTLEPNLGVVQMGPERSFVMADIPGIIEGAHEGVGLGHDFLRHIERTRVLVHVVDVSGIEGREPIADFEAINNELLLYSQKLASRPQVVAANKTDILCDPSLLENFKKYLAERDIALFEISAATKAGVRPLLEYVEKTLAALGPAEVYEPEIELFEPEIEVVEEAPFEIYKDPDGAYVIDGQWIDKLLGSVNFDDDESAAYFQRALRRKGVIDALEQAGISEGDTVRVGEIEFDFIK